MGKGARGCGVVDSSGPSGCGRCCAGVVVVDSVGVVDSVAVELVDRRQYILSSVVYHATPPLLKGS